ncbi:MAG: tartrate-resistant acid phosphatase type 5 family protein [Rhodothermales bacterium]|nr:tartrate-resistant acid phosphatase type 5 family protein [Rhodothermales bacterium]
MKALSTRVLTLDRLVVLGLVVLLAGCLRADPTPFTPFLDGDEIVRELPSDEGGVKFLALGDWGRMGDDFQNEVARSMGDVAREIDADFVVTVGDNFYPTGVTSTYDPHWIQSFEAVYTDSSLMIPWYITLGNHDYKGDVEAQLRYDGLSERWELPARYYTRVEPIDDTTSVRLLFIDTLPIYRLRYDRIRGQRPQEHRAAAYEQLRWIDSTLTASTSQWTVVVGHHPIFSGGFHGENEILRDWLLPILRKHEVDAYIAGHDHHLEYLYDGQGMHHFVSGGGSRLRRVKSHRYTQFAQTRPGFLSVAISPLQMLAQFVDHQGNILFGTVIDRRVDPPLVAEDDPEPAVLPDSTGQ